MRVNKIVLAITITGIVMLILNVMFLQKSVFYQTAVILSLLVAGVPFIASQYLVFRRAKIIEENLPDFLRDVAESNRAGMPLGKALEIAAHGAYGPLSKEMKIVSSQVSWGVPFEETLKRFASRVKSKMVRQAILIIIESHRSGGEIADVLETVAVDIKTLERIESERKSKLKIYLISIYFIFFLFLGIIVALTISFVPSTPELSEAGRVLGGSPSTLSEDDFKNFFFHLCIIQAFFGGLIGGQMGVGSLTAGIKHSVILIAVTILVFQFLLVPPNITDRLSGAILKIPPTTKSVEATPTPFTVYEGTTSVRIANAVLEKAKSDEIEGYEYITPASIRFRAQDCPPCSMGDIIVSPGTVLVNRPCKVAYVVFGKGDGTYTIVIRGGETG